MVALPKSYLSNIEKGAKVKVKSIDTGQDFFGIVSRINSKVNTQTQSVEVFIRIKDKRLKEGCTCKPILMLLHLIMYLL